MAVWLHAHLGNKLCGPVHRSKVDLPAQKISLLLHEHNNSQFEQNFDPDQKLLYLKF